MGFWYKSFKKFLLVVTIILTALIVYLFGTVFTEQNYEWFLSLNKPSLQPPSWAFMIIWGVLFILIAASAIIVLFAPGKEKKRCNLVLIIYIINALLNALYSVLFFGFHNIELALFQLPFFLASIILMIMCSYKVNKIAAYLLIPYLLWGIYATILMVNIYFINF